MGRHAAVLVFGESEHDRQAIRHLAAGLRPDLASAIEVRRRPLVLIKNATLPKARDNAAEIAAVAAQEARIRPVLAVLAHEDCDDVEPAHEKVEARIEENLKRERCPGTPIAVAPAWEIEAWWLVFPEAVGRVVRGWRDPDDWVGKDVGRIRDAKEALAKAVLPRTRTPGGAAPRSYEERDSVAIARNIAEDGSLGSFDLGRRTTRSETGAPVHTRSASLESFRSKVLAIRRDG